MSRVVATLASLALELALALSVVVVVARPCTAGEVVKILSGGPATVAALTPKIPELERIAEDKVEFAVTPIDAAMSAFGKGLVDGLILGTEPEQFFKESEKKGIGTYKVEDFQWIEVAEGTVKLALSPAQAVPKFTAQQLTDILSGKITSWEPIDGRKLPITVVVPTAYALTARAMMRHYLKSDTSPVATYVSDKAGAMRAIEKNPGAVAVLGVREKTPTFEPKYFETEATFPIFLVMKKPARTPAQKVFNHLKSQPKVRAG